METHKNNLIQIKYVYVNIKLYKDIYKHIYVYNIDISKK